MHIEIESFIIILIEALFIWNLGKVEYNFTDFKCFVNIALFFFQFNNNNTYVFFDDQLEMSMNWTVIDKISIWFSSNLIFK